VDKKASTAAHHNISIFEEANPQAAHYILFPIANVKLVKGADRIATFRLRPQSTTVRTYTTCCFTTVVAMIGPDSLMIKLPGQVLFNYNCVTPAITCSNEYKCRINCNEAVKPHSLPKDGIKNYSGIPLWFIFNDLSRALFGSSEGGKKCTDPATRALLYIDPKSVVDIAGVTACKS